MARTAIVRSASLAPAEAALADELAEVLANGSLTELIRLMLHRSWLGTLTLPIAFQSLRPSMLRT